MNARPALSSRSETSAQILTVAERLAQTRGFNGFSYADIAAELSITKASLHYHFATKAELGRALIVRYCERFEAALARIERAADAVNRIDDYIRLYESVLVADRMCLCGMFAAEYQTLPAAMQQALRRFFDANEAWLDKNLDYGRKAGALHFRGTAIDAARMLTSALEGAMLMARVYEERARFTTTANSLLAELVVAHRFGGEGERIASSGEEVSRQSPYSLSPSHCHKLRAAP